MICFLRVHRPYASGGAGGGAATREGYDFIFYFVASQRYLVGLCGKLDARLEEPWAWSSMARLTAFWLQGKDKLKSIYLLGFTNACGSPYSSAVENCTLGDWALIQIRPPSLHLGWEESVHWHQRTLALAHKNKAHHFWAYLQSDMETCHKF